MQIKVEAGALETQTVDVIVVNQFEADNKPTGQAISVDKALGGLIADELKHGKTFEGKLGQTLLLPTYGKLPSRYVLVVGLGKQADCKTLQLRRAGAAAIRACIQLKAKNVAAVLPGVGMKGVPGDVAARLLAEGVLLGSYRFTTRKSKKETKEADSLANPIQTLTIVEADKAKLKLIQTGIETGEAIAKATNMARDLCADSANFITPTVMAKTAQKITHPQISCQILEQKDCEKLKMGSFLSVAKGSTEPLKFIHLTYTPKTKPKKKIALVGKGITFDSGGLSLKPANAMEWMKIDMTGAAVVIAVMQAIAALGGLNVQVDAIAPCCENMPSGHANRPGDIVTAMNGKTIEINNTDAEGRLILCDALTYVQETVKPDEIIDLATLTGACIMALGKAASGMMGTSEPLLSAVQQAGEIAGERYWPLPLYDDFKEMLKSDVADLINSGSKGQAGSSAGGMFLKEFINEGQAWVHLDIAGPAYTDKDLPEVPKGATGVGVRTLLYYLYQL